MSADLLREQLKTHVQEAIGVWKYPRWVEVVESLPKTATGRSSASGCGKQGK